MPTVNCPHCGGALKVPEAAIGKNGRCPKCQQTFTVALPQPTAAAKPIEPAPSDDDSYGIAPSAPALAVTSKPAGPAPAASASLNRDVPSEKRARPTAKATRPSRDFDHDDDVSRRPRWLLPAAIAGGAAALFLLGGIVVGMLGVLGVQAGLGRASGVIDLAR